MPDKKFQRTIEDFTCSECGLEVHGNGYTNHCPRCLWSRHVDVNPGDRAADCGGPMEPVGLEVSGGEEFIRQRCTCCGHERRNRTSPDDSREEILRLSTAT
ncbi:MAG: RNHCP domain-containing protein [bacterium]